MEKVYSKQAEKFLAKLPKTEQEKVRKAIEEEKNLCKIADVHHNCGKRYRIKIDHYRSILYKKKDYFYVDVIDTKTNMKEKKYGYF